MPQRYAMAAASVILVASASLAVVARTFGGADQVTVDSVSTAPGDSAPAVRLAASAGILVTGGLSDLSDDDLTALLAELDQVEAMVAAEPATLRRALVDDPENF